MPVSSTLPLIDLNQLPVETVTLPVADLTLLAVRGNTATIRIDANVLFNALTVQKSSTVPTSTTDPLAGNIAWDASGLYVKHEGTWRHVLTSDSNWTEQTSAARNLIVNAAQALTPGEKTQALSNLGVGDATTSVRGLVRKAATMDDNTGAVPTAAMVKDFVAEALHNLSVPGGTPGSAGDKISSYQGTVDIKGPNGEAILSYSEDQKVLYVGAGVTLIRTGTDTGIEFCNADGTVISAIDTPTL